MQNNSGISLPVFPSRTNLKLHNILKMVKKIIMNLDLSKVSDHDCVPVVVLKNCEPELSHILAEIFNKCLMESCFPDCWKVSSMVLYLRMLGKGLRVRIIFSEVIHKDLGRSDLQRFREKFQQLEGMGKSCKPPIGDLEPKCFANARK